jgi:hypothetical protein
VLVAYWAFFGEKEFLVGGGSVDSILERERAEASSDVAVVLCGHVDLDEVCVASAT